MREVIRHLRRQASWLLGRTREHFGPLVPGERGLHLRLAFSGIIAAEMTKGPRALGNYLKSLGTVLCTGRLTSGLFVVGRGGFGRFEHGVHARAEQLGCAPDMALDE